MRHDRERPKFSNNLTGATSPYLLQHAHNPVFWYPWGKHAIERAREENKPIFLSIGYSTCYWCHVMEREVFENLSIASQLNRFFINIKVDREEHPALDDIYMVARQLMTGEGGWPNNLFLTPDLKPFYATGTMSPDESSGRPSFPRVLEQLNYEWTMNGEATQAQANENARVMSQFLVHAQPEPGAKADVATLSGALLESLKKHYDARAGGFFQAPKFPHENYVQFLLAYHAHTGNEEALEMATFCLRKMAAGGINDQVGGGFHRYAVDKQWYVPHFEKMLYTQALLARAFTDAARLSDTIYLADTAMSILDFVSGAFTDNSGAFYTAIDAENDGVEGAFYAWTPEEIEAILEPEETGFFIAFFALADIPTFPGHPHTPGKVLVARKSLDIAAREHGMPYVQVSAMAGQLLNKLLKARNKRQAPDLDNKIIVAWNGLMIDALAHGGRIFERPDHIEHARIAATYLLEHAIDNNGSLKRIIASGRAELAATLEDYAYLIRGLLSLHRTGVPMLEAAQSLALQAEERLGDNQPGYFFNEANDDLWVRIKSGDDSTLPNPNAVMLQNWLELFEFTGNKTYLAKARAMADHFLSGEKQALPEYAGMITAALALHKLETGEKLPVVKTFSIRHVLEEEQVAISATWANEKQIDVTLIINDGWHINMGTAARPDSGKCQVDAQGEGVEVAEILYPDPVKKIEMGEMLKVYEGTIVVKVMLQKPIKKGQNGQEIRLLLSFQPCNGTTCYPLQNETLTV